MKWNGVKEWDHIDQDEENGYDYTDQKDAYVDVEVYVKVDTTKVETDNVTDEAIAIETD